MIDKEKVKKILLVFAQEVIKVTSHLETRPDEWIDRYAQQICDLEPKPCDHVFERTGLYLRKCVDCGLEQVRDAGTEPIWRDISALKPDVPMEAEMAWQIGKPVFFQPNETGTSYRKVEPEPDESRLLTEKDLPWLYNFTVTKGNIDSILEYQDTKTASIKDAEIEKLKEKKAKLIARAIPAHGGNVIIIDPNWKDFNKED